jgi:alkylation response protein AidB-like acyl-CoA dehydrogenase
MEAVQILGGNGYMREYRLEQLARDAKLLQIGGGTDEIQLVTCARACCAGTRCWGERTEDVASRKDPWP